MAATSLRQPKRGRRIMDPQERAAFRESRQAEDRERMEAASAALLTDDGFAAYVQTRATFHNYSVRNCMLIAQQYPEATAVASYRTWQSMGRQVRKGEHGIKILAPMTVAKPRERRLGGLSHGSSVAQMVAAGRETLEESTGPVETRVRFKSVSVFDISQTDGEPIDIDPPADVSAILEALRAPQSEDDVEAAVSRVDELLGVESNR
jgi:antirestriction protein ArdC